MAFNFTSIFFLKESVPHAGGVAEHGVVPVVGFVEEQDVHAYHGQNCDEKQRGYRAVF